MKIGDIVRPKDTSIEVLACGSGIYEKAIIRSLEPFTLISEDGDMIWFDLNKDDFVVIGEVKKKPVKFELTVTDATGSKATVELSLSKDWVNLIDDLQKSFIVDEKHPLAHYINDKWYGKERRLEKVKKEIANYMRDEIMSLFEHAINIQTGWINSSSNKWYDKKFTKENTTFTD